VSDEEFARLIRAFAAMAAFAAIFLTLVFIGLLTIG
jgi:hypothetical protein